jgi:hypothetical protein
MMAADSLHVAVHLIVPSGVSFCWPSPCRRACSAGAFAPHFALPPAQPSTCRRLASNAPGLRPWPRSPARWLLSAAAPPGRRCPERQRGAKAEGKTKGRGTGPRRKPVCTWGWRGTERLRRRAAWGASPRQCRHVRVLRTTGHARACRERSHDRPPRRRFPHPPQRPEEPGPGLRFQGAQAGGQGQQRQVLGAPSWRPAAGRAPASGPARAWGAATRRRASRGEADAHVAARDHQDAAGQPAPGQPAVARQAPALHRARWRGPRWRAGPSLRAADRRRRPRCLQGTLRRRPAPFPLHPLARGWRRAGRPAHLHAAPDGPHGSRPGHAAGLGGGRSLEHRQPAHPPRSCAGATTPAKTSSSRATTSPTASAIGPPNWRPNGWGRAPSWRSSRPCSARWSKSGGRAWIAPCNARPARMAECRSNASTNRSCNASACC